MSDEWRETTDPDELAAAVAAGVRVEVAAASKAKWMPSTSRDARDFRGWIAFGNHYRVPASWVYAPPPPRADAVQLLRDLQDAACSVMARPDVLGMLHGQTRHALSDLIVDLALALDSLVVMS